MLELAPGPGVITSGSLGAGRLTETDRETSRRNMSADGRSGSPRPVWVLVSIPGAGATTTGKHGKQTLTGKRLTLTLTGPRVTARAALRGSRGRRAAAGGAQTRMTAGNVGSTWWTDGPLLLTNRDARRSLTLSSERIHFEAALRASSLCACCVCEKLCEVYGLTCVSAHTTCVDNVAHTSHSTLPSKKRARARSPALISVFSAPLAGPRRRASGARCPDLCARLYF